MLILISLCYLKIQELASQFNIIWLGCSSCDAYSISYVFTTAITKLKKLKTVDCRSFICHYDMNIKEVSTKELLLTKSVNYYENLDMSSSICHFSHYMESINQLIHMKNQKGLSISLVIPTLNEEATIGAIIQSVNILKKSNLIDELIIFDGGSSDQTIQICNDLSANVLSHHMVENDVKSTYGKGLQLWKSLYATTGDIIVWIDSDIRQFNNRFVIGLIGPMIMQDSVKFSKAFYQRPYTLSSINELRDSDDNQESCGGRVTELCARPLFNAFYPDLSTVIQPLSGEYAFRRSVVEDLEFSSGFGVETLLLIDFYKKYGLSSMVQVDMGERIHRNKPLSELSKTSFMIFQIFKYCMQISDDKSTSTTLKVANNKKSRGFSASIDNYFSDYECKETILPPVRHKVLSSLELSHVYLIRHGQTEENINNIIQGHYDNNLNQTGRKQADILGHRLKKLNIDFDSVYCSDLKRCQQTLAIINEIVHLGDTVITPLLRERDYGKWTNKCFKQDQGNSNVIEVSDNGSSLGWEYLSSKAIPSAENFDSMQERILKIIKQISFPGDHLIVTHSGVLNLLYRYTKQLSYQASIPMLSWSNCGIYRLSFNPQHILQHLWDMNL